MNFRKLCYLADVLRTDIFGIACLLGARPDDGLIKKSGWVFQIRVAIASIGESRRPQLDALVTLTKLSMLTNYKKRNEIRSVTIAQRFTNKAA